MHSAANRNLSTRAKETGAILNIGREDVVVEGMKPVEPEISILGASSDHLIMDVTEAENVRLGSELAFFMNYGALLAAMTSEYVLSLFGKKTSEFKQ